MKIFLCFSFMLVVFLTTGALAAERRDTFADTWVATDALGRALPTAAEVGPPRANRTIGMFYFLWHGVHGQAGPFNISQIMAAHPDALSHATMPPWGPVGAMHHWAEPIFGFYLSDDEAVYRKHAQMLADAGVDVVVFDVTNGWTYRESYRALMRAFSQVRAQGGTTPQIAFLCPFGSPPPGSARAKVVHDLWENIYRPGLHPELWFRWQGKPLLLSNPDNLRGDFSGISGHSAAVPLQPGHSLGQTFRAERQLLTVEGTFPTWHTAGAGLTLTLRRGADEVARKRCDNIADNAWLGFSFDPPLSPGDYTLEASDPAGRVGWWSSVAQTNAGATVDGIAAPGSREFRFRQQQENQANRDILAFFTFRDPQPSYFVGPVKPNMWSWLEVYPQHVFSNDRGEKEMMAVGVAQNAVSNRLGAMSEPLAMGRSTHNGKRDTSPGAVDHGYNFAEQFERALREDPPFLFVTGWNEWVASRFTAKSFVNVDQPAVFPDQFDQERSRDIEPMKGGHGDNYYYQLAAFVRRYKGARPIPPVASRPIQIDGQFADWRDVSPEFRDDIGDPVQRDHPGWGAAGRYVNKTGRNDLTLAKISLDNANLSFYIQTAAPLSPRTDPNWMLLFIDADQNPATGWMGYDFVVNRAGAGKLERHQAPGYQWTACAEIPFAIQSNELELSIPLAALSPVLHNPPAAVDFKWADNIQQTGDWSDFTLNGDTAPNDRFNYRAILR